MILGKTILALACLAGFVGLAVASPRARVTSVVRETTASAPTSDLTHASASTPPSTSVSATHPIDTTSGESSQGAAHAHSDTTAIAAPRPAPWTPEIVDAFGALPVQDGGRIKPVSTYAAFTLLRVSGRRTAVDATGATIDPVAWLLEVVFRTDDALRARNFLVSDADALVAAGLAVGDRAKRDRWSYEELQPCLPRLFQLAHDYDAIAPKDRTALQRQVVDLASNVMAFVRLARFLDFARTGDPTWSNALALIPPETGAPPDAEWSTPADVLRRVAPGTTTAPAHEAALASLRTMDERRDEPAAFAAALASLRENVVSAAAARGQYDDVDLERAYYAWNPLGWSLGLFLAAFLACATSWLRPSSEALRRVATGLVALGTAFLVGAIVVRCVLRGRPPVSTLYETVLFTTACGAILATVLELLHRSRVAISAAAFLGLVGLFVANGYETLDKQDTMPSLVAVLDTNFWLATHVTAITIGYAAGMLAALLGSTYLLLRLFGWKRHEPQARRQLARSVYGILCFALVFSLVGTVLGGIWANESWGRFWGWDPKENGALLIVISQVLILHARRAGFLRDHGTCMAAAFGGTVIAFSWWGVNLLGVGLHSYGFTSGVQTALWTYYGVQWGVVVLGGVAAWRERAAKSLPAPVALARVDAPAAASRDRAAA